METADTNGVHPLREVLGSCFALFRKFTDFGTIFKYFFERLRSKLSFNAIFLIFHRFSMDSGWMFGRFSDNLSMIFRIFFENADLQNSCAHAVFRKGRACKNPLKIKKKRAKSMQILDVKKGFQN